MLLLLLACLLVWCWRRALHFSHGVGCSRASSCAAAGCSSRAVQLQRQQQIWCCCAVLLPYTEYASKSMNSMFVSRTYLSPRCLALYSSIRYPTVVKKCVSVCLSCATVTRECLSVYRPGVGKSVERNRERNRGRKTSEASETSETSETSVLASERHAKSQRRERKSDAQQSVPIEGWHRSWHAM